MKSTLIKRFREFWGSLSKSERESLWDILSALRGSDDRFSNPIKYRTTSRIRAELFGTEFAPDIIGIECYSQDDIIYWDRKRTVKDIHERWNALSSHFRAHIQEAIDALNLHVPKSKIRDLQKFLRW